MTRPAPGVQIANRRFRVGGLTLVQETPTTCGTTVLQALQLLSGERPAQAYEPGKFAVKALQDELHQEQQELQQSANRMNLGPLQWPRSLGTSPWALASEFTWPGHTYRLLWTGNRRARWPEQVAQIVSFLEADVPVPLLVGGALRGVPFVKIPRHYVLALPWRLCTNNQPTNGEIYVFDPSSGRVESLDFTELDGSAQRAFGGWAEVFAVYIPCPQRSELNSV